MRIRTPNQYPFVMNLGLPIILIIAISIILPAGNTAFARDLTIDAAQRVEDWPHFYEESVGACHPITVLSSSYGRNIQGALQKGHDEAGFKRIRPHGILNSSVDIYNLNGGNPSYNWTTFDQIYDTLRSFGMVPIVELSHTPKALKSSDASAFWYNGHSGNISPISDYPKWRDLVKEIVLHCEARYGVDEVRNQWYFEVYNEPDLPYFFAGSKVDYQKMYDWAAEGVRLADPQVRIGGPATSGNQLYYTGHISPEEFIDHALNQPNYVNGQIGIKCDFLSYHRYANDGGFNGNLSKPASMIDYHNAIIDIMNQYGFTGEVMCTEWAPTYSAIADHSDTESAASFIAKTIHLLNDNGSRRHPDIYSWWVISDIFEEWNAYQNGPRPAYGGLSGSQNGTYGLLLIGDPNIPDSHDLAKTTFNAFKLLHLMGDERLACSGGTTGNGVNGTATINSIDELSIQILIYNHVDGAGADSSQGEQVNLTVNNIPFAPGQVKVEHYVIDRYHSNSYRAWQNMGSPYEPSSSQWTTLKNESELDYLDPTQTITLSSNTFTKSFEAKTYSTSLIILTSDEPPIPPPTNVTAISYNGSEVELSWQDNTAGQDQEDHFIIQRKPHLGDDNWYQVGTASQDATEYTDTDEIYGMIEYTYRIGAYK